MKKYIIITILCELFQVSFAQFDYVKCLQTYWNKRYHLIPILIKTENSIIFAAFHKWPDGGKVDLPVGKRARTIQNRVPSGVGVDSLLGVYDDRAFNDLKF